VIAVLKVCLLPLFTSFSNRHVHMSTTSSSRGSIKQKCSYCANTRHTRTFTIVYIIYTHSIIQLSELEQRRLSELGHCTNLLQENPKYPKVHVLTIGLAHPTRWRRGGGGYLQESAPSMQTWMECPLLMTLLEFWGR